MAEHSENISEMQQEVRRLCAEKNVLFLAHNYQRPEVQDLADLVGDSLALSIAASKSDATMILFAGVHFMAESAKILSPDKKVLMPRIDAGCPMADMADAESLLAMKQKHPDAAVVTYVNSTAEVKAETDICCTSANAVNVVKSLEAKEILFVPDKNLGAWVAKHVPDKTVHLWPGYCHVHDVLTATLVREMKRIHPYAPFVAHPECRAEVLELADHVASTSGMLAWAPQSNAEKAIIGTETGLLHRLALENPDMEFIGFKQMVCPNMKKTRIEDVLAALREEHNEIDVPEAIRVRAKGALDRMIAVPRS